MTMMAGVRAKAFDPRALAEVADWLAVAVAVSLPWSTTATGILVVVWLIATLPTLDVALVRRELTSAAGGLPVLLFALGAVGMLWADVSWSERFGGFGSFHRFLFVPLLLAQFRRSRHGGRVLLGFFASVATIMVLSWALVLFPSLPWRANGYGIPVKDYILQSEEFLMAAFAVLAAAFDYGQKGRWRSAAALAGLAALFLANIAFVATGRTTLVVAPVLAILLGWRQFRWKGALGAVLLFALLAAVVWAQSPYLRARLNTSIAELQTYRTSDTINSTALHVEFLRKSLSFVKTAPIIGHGTGSIGKLFRDSAVGQTGVEAADAVNPHNQILAVGIQLGLVGIAVLLAMWTAHWLLFRGRSLTAWIGTIVVSESIVASLFNSHLFDFTQAWIYIFGVGVTGGMMLRGRAMSSQEPQAGLAGRQIASEAKPFYKT